MPWPPPSEVLGESDGAKDGLAEPDAELADSAIAQVLEADDLFQGPQGRGATTRHRTPDDDRYTGRRLSQCT